MTAPRSVCRKRKKQQLLLAKVDEAKGETETRLGGWQWHWCWRWSGLVLVLVLVLALDGSSPQFGEPEPERHWQRPSGRLP